MTVSRYLKITLYEQTHAVVIVHQAELGTQPFSSFTTTRQLSKALETRKIRKMLWSGRLNEV